MTSQLKAMGRKSVLVALFVAFVLMTFSGALHAKPLAVLTSGGIDIFSNHGRYYRNLRIAAEVLSKNWNILTLAADGPQSTAPNSTDIDESGRTVFDHLGLPVLRRLEPKTNYVGPATYEAIESALRSGLSSVQKGEPVLLYFTDHGSRGGGPKDRNVCLWNERLTVSQLRTLVEMVPSGSDVILINDQCYGGGMLEALWNGEKPFPNVCGFAASTESQVAFGGGGVMKSIGEFVDAKAEAAEAFSLKDWIARKTGRGARTIVQTAPRSSFRDVYEDILTRGTWTRNSTPISSSDLYLQKYYEAHRQRSSTSSGEICAEPDGIGDVMGRTFERADDPLIVARIQQLYRDLKWGLGVLRGTVNVTTDRCQNITDEFVEEVHQNILKKEKELSQFDHLDRNHLKPKLKDLIIHGWLKELGNPKLYKDYKEALDRLAAVKTSGRKRTHEEKLLRKDLELLEQQVNLYVTAVLEGGNATPLAADFRVYAKTHCAKLDSADGCALTMNEINPQIEGQRNDRQMSELRTILTPAWRFYRDLVSTRGLQLLLDTGSLDDIRSYYFMLSCEETRI